MSDFSNSLNKLSNKCRFMDYGYLCVNINVGGSDNEVYVCLNNGVLYCVKVDKDNKYLCRLNVESVNCIVDTDLAYSDKYFYNYDYNDYNDFISDENPINFNTGIITKENIQGIKNIILKN